MRWISFLIKMQSGSTVDFEQVNVSCEMTGFYVKCNTELEWVKCLHHQTWNQKGIW